MKRLKDFYSFFLIRTLLLVTENLDKINRVKKIMKILISYELSRYLLIDDKIYDDFENIFAVLETV